MAKPFCNAVDCRNLRIRPNSTHCPSHEPEWHAIQRDQKRGVTAGIRQRRISMGMTEFPRTYALGRREVRLPRAPYPPPPRTSNGKLTRSFAAEGAKLC